MLLQWLVQKLPKTTKSEEDVTTASPFQQKLLDSFKAWKKTGWAPSVCHRFVDNKHLWRYGVRAASSSYLTRTTVDRLSSDAGKGYSSKFLRHLDMQPLPGSLPESVASTVTQELFLQKEHQNDWISPGASSTQFQARKRDVKTYTKSCLSMTGTATGPSNIEHRQSLYATVDFDSIVKDIAADVDTPATPSAFANASKFGQETVATVETQEEDAKAAEEERQAELEQLRERLTTVNAEVAEFTKRREETDARIRGLESQLQRVQEQNSTLKRDYELRKSVLEMLPDATAHIQQLKDLCAQSAARLVTLAAEWESHRLPMIQSIRELKKGKLLRTNAAAEMVAEMKQMREQIAHYATAIREKEERLADLQAAWERMPKEANRSTYTKRIMDIIKQIRKQDAEILRVVQDIKSVQHDINELRAKLERTATVASEQLYNAVKAKKNDQSYVASYRHFTTLREEFANLARLVKATANVENESRDLEKQIDVMQKRASSQNKEQLFQDLQQIQAENEALAAQVK